MKSSMGLGAESPWDSPLFEVLANRPVSRGVVRADSLALAAARHGVSALVADALDRQQRPVPERLARDARSQLGQGLKNKRLTLSVLDALARRGVTPILLKGYGLAVRLYPEQPLARPATDVDLLVAKAELVEVAAALEALGLRQLGDPGLADVFEEHHHLSFVGPGGLVEVHFRLIATLGRGEFDDDALRERAREWKLEGRSVRLLDAEDEFLYLATHAANHAFLRISWLVDLQRLLEGPTAFDWTRMAERARRAGFHTAVATALELVDRLLEAPVPEQARRSFEVRRLRGAVDRGLFSGRLVESALLSDHRLGAFLVRLWLVDSPQHGVRHLVDGARRFVRRLRAEA